MTTTEPYSGHGQAYTSLRRNGTIIVQADQAANVTAAMRRRAGRDGYRISASRSRGRGLSPSQARERPTHISLCEPDGIHIARPDAEAPAAQARS